MIARGSTAVVRGGSPDVGNWHISDSQLRRLEVRCASESRYSLYLAIGKLPSSRDDIEPALAVEPDVLHAPAVVLTVDHDRQPCNLRRMQVAARV
jgi:hypothetical protein